MASDEKPSAHEWSIAFSHARYGRLYMDAWSTTLCLMDQGVPEDACAGLLAFRDTLLASQRTGPRTTSTGAPTDG